MQILYVSSYVPHPGSVAGGVRVMWNTLTRLAANHRIDVVAFADPHVPRDATAALAGLGITLHVAERPFGRAPWAVRRPVYAARWLAGSLPLRAIAFGSGTMQRLIDRVQTGRAFDLVHVEDSAMGQYRIESRAPRLLIEHEVRCDIGIVEKARWLRFQRRVWGGFDRIQAFTERDRSFIARVAPDVSNRVRSNPFGVEPTDVPIDDEHPGRILFVGGFLHPPNVDAALWLAREIMPRLRRSGAGGRLVVAGADPPRALRALAGADIEVTGRVEDMRPYLGQASVVVAPLRRGGGMRVKVLEAMAAGKAVVATTLGAEGVADDLATAPLVLADDADAFARAVARLLQDGEERRRLGRAAREHVRTHRTWDAYVARLERTYQELLRDS